MEQDTARLAPPVVASLRVEAAGPMYRTISEDIREEREELREAAEQTLNVIMDLNLDGTIRWASPSWADVLGTQPEYAQGTAIADLIVSDNKNIFADTVPLMKKDDSQSQFVRFAMNLGPLSKLLSLDSVKEPDAVTSPQVVELEAQGIMVYSVASGEESHVSSCRSQGFRAKPLIPENVDDVDDSALDFAAGHSVRPAALDR